MKEQILKLRSQGKTYLEIEKELGVRRSTISYHCGEGQKQKSFERSKKLRQENAKHIIGRKIDRYVQRKVIDFKYGGLKGSGKRRRERDVELAFDHKKAFDIISNTKKCYLSGRDIDIIDSRSYHLDHIIPLSREGGTSELTNMGIACREANLAKSDMLVEEFVELCKDVLVNFGYEVIKK